MTEEATDTTIDVNTASRNELFGYAKNVLGLAVEATMTKEQIRQLVAKQTGQAMEGESAEAGKQVEKNLRDLRKAPKKRIRIHENPDHPKRITVCVNGVTYTLKPGVYIDVPEPVVEVLRNAKRTTYRTVEENGKMQTIASDSLAYPFEVAP